MREILEGIYTWPWFSERHGYNFNGYLLTWEHGNICIDPVEPDAATLDEIARLGAARIVLTNRNHVRAANTVRSRTKALTAIHRLDAEHARNQGAELDAVLRAGERVGALVAIAVPGKSPGELALHWPERRLLIVGDAIIGNPPGRCSLLPERVMDDPPQLRASLRQLMAVDFDVLLVGDGVPILDGARERLRELIDSWGKEHDK